MQQDPQHKPPPRLLRLFQFAVALAAVCSAVLVIGRARIGADPRPAPRHRNESFLQALLFPGGVAALDGGNNNLRHPTWGESGTAYTRMAPDRLHRRHRRDAAGTGDAVHQQPRLQRQVAEPLLRERRDAVGLRLGPVRRPHDRPAADPGRTTSRSRSTTTTRSRTSRTTSAVSPSDARQAMWGTGVTTPRAHTNTVVVVHRCVGGVRRQQRPPRVDARGPGRWQPRQQQREAAAARRLPATRATPAATRPRHPRWTSWAGSAARRRTPSSPATCVQTRISP